MSDNQEIFICSFCEKRIRYKPELRGKHGKCPSCSRPVTLFDNQHCEIENALTSAWYYKAPKLIIGIQQIGPVADIDLIQLVDEGQIDANTQVMSPEITDGKWGELSQVKVSTIRERIAQRAAEVARRLAAEERNLKIAAENHNRLKQSIRAAVESGNVSLKHREAFEKFAASAGIPNDVVKETIERESESALREVFEEALEDGILEPREEQQISQLALALGVDLRFLRGEEHRINLCRLAYEIDSGSFEPNAEIVAPFKLAAKEAVLESVDAAWFEVVTLKRPAGIPLGGDNYLKEVAAGVVYLTTKQITVVGELSSKKITLSSVTKATRFTDGILFNRSSGKSVFVKIDQATTAGGRFGLIAEHACSGEPVLGHIPDRSFVPISPSASDTRVDARAYNDSPRYTFRVVGDHVDDRGLNISRINIGDAIRLVREPHNPFDGNAVAVVDRLGNMLGYLKRDVASWFGPMLDREGNMPARAHAFTSAGSLIVSVDR
ncbi:HIRAN domain-containing protein [Roseiconus lacunae]|uniref:HIRAN domain-containing protein n=1 Tax=Roseiconus lacunae TaxID=2605694 RepID=UPI003087AD25|nr:HIRAN domain-containing protein [Stieleria sp. HD01]